MAPNGALIKVGLCAMDKKVSQLHVLSPLGIILLSGAHNSMVRRPLPHLAARSRPSPMQALAA